MGFGETEGEISKLPSISLSQHPKARQERIVIRRARIKARIAAARQTTGSDDGDDGDADLPITNSSQKSTHRRQSRSRSRGAIHSHAQTHDHSQSHPHTHAHHSHHAHGHSKKEEVQSDRPQQVPLVPGGKIVIIKPVEIDPILTIDQKLISHVDKSKILLEQLLLDAETFVTNVKVAAEYRERTRHDIQEESKKTRLEKLEKEAEECEEMFQNLSSNWFTSAKGVLPLELYEMIQDQQKSCDDLLEKKQDLIDSLKSEIESNDVDYETDLQKHQKDLMLMGDRIDEQVETMRLAFMKELDLLEEYTCNDRKTMMEDNEKEWSSLLQEFDQMEENTLDAMHSATLERFNTLSDLYTQSREQTRKIKVKLENDMRTLQLEAEQIKIAAILNAEKLEYNLEILRRRENENLRMKSSMKRLILNLQDRFNDKAKALQDIVKAAKRENELLIKEIKRLEFLNKDAMHKALHEVATDYRKYMDLWKMSEDETRDKMLRLIGTEKFILENYLGVEASENVSFAMLDDRPDEVQSFFMKQVENIDNTKSKINNTKDEDTTAGGGAAAAGSPNDIDDGGSGYSSSVGHLNKTRSSNASLIIEPTNSIQFLPGPSPDPAVQRRLMKHITKVICDQTGFVIEEKLRKILTPMIKTEQSLIHIDAVLQALGVTNFSEMQILTRYMLRESKVMRGVMSKMGTAVTPDISSMRLSAGPAPSNEEVEILMSALMSKVAQASRPQLDVEKEDEPRNLLITASSSDFSVPENSDIPKSAEIILTKAIEHGVTQVADFQFGTAPKHTQNYKVPENESSGVLTPVSEVSTPSLGLIIEQFSSDEALANVLRQVEMTKTGKVERKESDGEEVVVALVNKEIEGSNSDSTCNSSSICSCESVEGHLNQPVYKPNESVKTTEATILSWGKVEPNKFECEPMFPGQSGTSGGENHDQGELDDGSYTPKAQGVGIRTPPAPPEDLKAGPEITTAGSGGRSQTISIPSLATTSAGSDEFLYIEPNDVLRALASFCKDYNAKIKIELPTEEELIDGKLGKLKFPDDSSVYDYWGRFLILLDPKSQELWDAILKCFGYYATVLEERNQLILDIERIYNENVELGYLMKKNYKGHCTGQNFETFNSSGLPYCEC